MATKRTASILDAGKIEPIKRHLETLQTIVRETNQSKRTVEAEKIVQKEDISDINAWNDEIENQLETADNEVKRLQDWLDEKENTQKFAAQEEQFQFEIKLHEKKLQMQTELASMSKNTPETKECEASFSQTAKLPKLVISKFEGSHMDLPRFWGQFTEAVDKSSIPPITKFTYLCELLGSRVKRCVEALPRLYPGGLQPRKSSAKGQIREGIRDH
jgi:vancomycin resistance protein YoaR